jgi:propanediol dehydratase small subunit
MNQAELVTYFQILGLQKVMCNTYRINDTVLFANTHQLQVSVANDSGYYTDSYRHPYPISIETLQEILL